MTMMDEVWRLWEVRFTCWGESKADRIGDRPMQGGAAHVWATSMEGAQNVFRDRFSAFLPTKEFIGFEGVNATPLQREHIINPEDGLHSEGRKTKLVGV